VETGIADAKHKPKPQPIQSAALGHIPEISKNIAAISARVIDLSVWPVSANFWCPEGAVSSIFSINKP